MGEDTRATSAVAITYEGGDTFWRRVVMIFFVFVQIGSFAGVVYGWPTLRIVLVKEGEFAELCDTPPVGTTPCDSQALRFGLIFTVGAWAAQASRLFIGLVLDRFGVLRSVLLCYSLIIPGILLMAFSTSTSFDAFIPGIFLISFGGAGLQLSSQPTSNVFPTVKTTILTSYSGAFNASSLVFLIFLAVYNAGAPYRDIFIGYSVYAVVLVLLGCALLPRTTAHLARMSPRRVLAAVFKKQRQDRDTTTTSSDSRGAVSTVSSDLTSLSDYKLDASEGNSLSELSSEGNDSSSSSSGGSNSSSNDSSAYADDGGVSESTSSSSSSSSWTVSSASSQDSRRTDLDASGALVVADALAPLSFKSQAYTREYHMVTVFFCVHVLTMQFYIGTAGDQLERKGDTEDATGFFYVQALVTANACSFIITPFLGYFIQRVGFPAAFAVVNTLIIIHNLISCFNSLEVQIVAFVAYGIGRVSLFASFFAFCGHTFGFTNYGKLAGLGSFLSAITSLFQYPLLSLTIDGLDGDFLYVNLLFILFALPLYGVCWYLHRRDIPARLVFGPLHVGSKRADEESSGTV